MKVSGNTGNPFKGLKVSGSRRAHVGFERAAFCELCEKLSGSPGLEVYCLHMYIIVYIYMYIIHVYIDIYIYMCVRIVGSIAGIPAQAKHTSDQMHSQARSVRTQDTKGILFPKPGGKSRGRNCVRCAL